ncbi:MAG TPA: HD domain-containing phosphohydrolase [Nitrospiraceae bacterium]|nr:HD domain-containing phosphohydrolase [Nitrospiraceae bacterium]
MRIHTEHTRRADSGPSPTGLPAHIPHIDEMMSRNDSRSRDEAIRTLILSMRTEDPRSHEHGERTALYAVALGKAVGFGQEELIHLHTAALLHDIGKLTLPAAILKKRGPLSAEEYELVQCHPRAGAEIVAAFPLLRMPAVWIAHHHERWDGSGYPYGLRGSFIPLGSRVLAVADLFDAVLSQRSPFDVTRNYQSAARQLELAGGSQLDPDLVSTFLKLTTDPVEILSLCFTAFAKP